MKNKSAFKFSNKKKLYHKLINNNLTYDNKSLSRYKKNEDEIMKYSSNDKVSELEDLKKRINSIKNCELKNSATKIVFSDGNLLSKIMIVGEGPGANEDKEGKPFVGRASCRERV